MQRALSPARPYLILVTGFAALTAVLAPLAGEEHTGIVALAFLMVALVCAARWGYGPGFAAAVLANLLVNFFFVRPLHRFSVAEPARLVELAIFLAVAFVGAYMLSRLREQAARARENQAATEFLLDVSHQVASAATPRQALDRLCEVAARSVGARGCAVLSGEPLAVVAATIDEPSNRPPTRDEVAMAAESIRGGEVGWLRGQREKTFLRIPGAVPAVLRFEGRIATETIMTVRFEGVLNEIRSAMERLSLSGEARRAEQLTRADAFKSLLLSSASHDLRTPLTAIKAAVSSLRDESVTWEAPDRAAFLETIETQADTLSATLANLLEVSRLEGGAARARFEPIEVGPMLAEAVLATREATRGREVRHCAPDGLWVRADYGLLMQALKNIIENAAKYSTPGAPIRLEGAEAPGRAVIRIVDGGPPIPQDDLPHLFEKFYRGRSGGGVKGTGLGLALVKAIVELAQGTVTAASDETGTTITLSLPRAGAPV